MKRLYYAIPVIVVGLMAYLIQPPEQKPKDTKPALVGQKHICHECGIKCENRTVDYEITPGYYDSNIIPDEIIDYGDRHNRPARITWYCPKHYRTSKYLVNGEVVETKDLFARSTELYQSALPE